MNRHIVFRIFLGLVALAAVVAVAAFAYQAGMANSLALNMPALMQNMRPDDMPRNGMPMPMMGGWGGGFGRPFGMLGFGFGILGFFFQIFLFVGVIWLISRLIFGFRRGPWGWGGHHGGPGGHNGWEQRGQQMFDDWHKQAHAGATTPPQESTPPAQ